MAKINEIINALEEFAPLETQESWDNSGWQVRLQKKDIKKVMLCVTLTDDVLKQTLEKHCDMVISHHPIFFNQNGVEKPLIKEIIRNHIPVYALHTPFDIAKNGTTDLLMRAAEMDETEQLNKYTKVSEFDTQLDELIQNLKSGLNLEQVRITNYAPNKVVKKIAFCAGSGTSFCDEVQNDGCDCFVTADLKYHTAVDFDGVLIDVGHLESEKAALQTFKEKLNMVECEIAQEKSPITIL